MIAAIVAPAGDRSIAMMRACLVWAPVAGLNDPGADRARDLGLLVFRAAERVAAFGLDLGLVMGSSEVCATPSVAPPQPRPANRPAGQDPEARLSRPQAPQQRSDQARKPVNSEQDSCSSGTKAHQAHNLEVIASNPIPAIKPVNIDPKHSAPQMGRRSIQPNGGGRHDGKNSSESGPGGATPMGHKTVPDRGFVTIKASRP